MRKLLLAAAALCVLSPAHAKGRPDWVDGQSSKYSRDAYLIGVGLADDRATAEDRARAEIAKIFSTQVVAVTASNAAESSSNSGGKTSNSFSQSVSNDVQTASKKALEGVEIQEKWQDEATRQYYALATLNRAKAMASVKDKLSDFDGQAQQWKSQMDSATDKLPRVKAAMKLLALLKARESLNADLRVLDASGTGSPAPFDVSAVRAAAAKAVSELDVIVDVR